MTAAALGDVFGHRDGTAWRVVALKPFTIERAIGDKNAHRDIRRPTPLTFSRDYFFIHADRRYSPRRRA